MRYYSKTTGGFYSDAIHAVLPADAVAVADEHHRALLDAQSAGKEIRADEDGFPRAAERSPTAERSRAELAHRARLALSASDATVLRCVEACVPVPAEWASYRKALRAAIGGEGGALPEKPAYPITN